MSRSVLRSELAGDEVLLVSNREPYIPMYQGDEIAMHFMVSHGGHRIAERIDQHREHTVEIG